MRETGHPVYVVVGQNIRLIRKARGLTQENLAAGLGVTFQQLQKYEKAANRVSCSMLIRICEQLGAHPMDLRRPSHQRPTRSLTCRGTAMRRSCISLSRACCPNCAVSAVRNCIPC
ncbi:helix-turn-helix transcriptional regulator [Asticcacaulis sp.]|uniref:helix-turn-helix domain-containing protein n=1 Tax=Asticcacaulis sp. TaxID=1872648 RepID=UPI0031D25A4B